MRPEIRNSSDNNVLNKIKIMYQVIKFDRSVNDFSLYKTSEDYVECVQDAILKINKEVDRYNNFKNHPHIDYVEYDEMYEIFENGQNYVINNQVFGVISVDKSNYKEYLLCINGGSELDDNDIKAIQIPFENMKYFEDYMMRIVLVFGGCYNLINLDEAGDMSGEIGVNDYLIRVKIGD